MCIRDRIELQKEQVLASINAIEQKTNSALPQIPVLQSQYNSQKANISVLQEQLQNAVRERNRTANLVKSDAATTKQLDDANGNIEVIQKQIQAAQTQLSTVNQQISAAKENVAIQNRAVLSERNPTEKKVAQFDEQLKHNIIPVSYTHLDVYKRQRLHRRKSIESLVATNQHFGTGNLSIGCNTVTD